MALERIAISMTAPAWAGLRGVSKVEITLKTHQVNWRFADRLAPAEATLDPLYASAPVLEAENQRVAIVFWTLSEASANRLWTGCARRPSSRALISCILAGASNTHSASVIRTSGVGTAGTEELTLPLRKPRGICRRPR
jgi:hypothetical protein